VTAIDAGERSGTFWAATNGGNFSFVDTRNLSSEPFTFGTVGRGVSALALGTGGELWLGGDGIGARSGITRADTTLQRWQQFESRIAGGPQGRVHALIATPAGVYAGAADGVYSLRSNRWHLVTDADGRALAHAGGRVWVGARGTLGWIDGTDNYQRVEFPLQTVHALAARNDTLWIAAETGLFTRANERLQQVSSIPVRDVTLAGGRVVMLTASGLQVWQNGGMELPLQTAALQQIGRPVSVSSSGERVWVGGTNGVAEWNTTTDAWRYLTVPDDIPEGPVYDIVAENERIWLATPAGALRLDWK
jgi:ligand-binding sensor domain-containing protein